MIIILFLSVGKYISKKKQRQQKKKAVFEERDHLESSLVFNQDFIFCVLFPFDYLFPLFPAQLWWL